MAVDVRSVPGGCPHHVDAAVLSVCVEFDMCVHVPVFLWVLCYNSPTSSSQTAMADLMKRLLTYGGRTISKESSGIAIMKKTDT